MRDSGAAVEPSEGKIPFRMVLGVTGHRKLDQEPALAAQVQRVLARIREIVPPSANTPVVFTILSPLAEGADRLVVREALKLPGAQLEVVLPLEKEDYLQDFALPESRAEFEMLLAQARSIKTLPQAATRNQSYAQIGRYVVDHCDILIALWNGKPAAGQGGTAEIVEYARQKKCPLFWLHTEQLTQLSEELGAGLDLRAYQDLDRYNSEPLEPAELQKHGKAEHNRLVHEAKDASLATDWLLVVCDKLLPHYTRADRLALRFQHRYLQAGAWVYALAALAVAVVAFQALFLPAWPQVVFLEVLLMAAVLAIIGVGKRQHWHSKWIDYRFLAERLRSALFLAVAGVEVGRLLPPRHLSLAYSSRDWMVAAFSSVWSQLPALAHPDPTRFGSLKRFLVAAWIDDQLSYHRKTSLRHGRRHRRLVYGGNILFGLTFVAALLHTVHLGPAWWQNLLTFLAIALPATGGALGAIRTHREYLRNASRSTEMVRHLEELKAEMLAAPDLQSLLSQVREAEETMLHENEDWRVVVRFHQLEPQA